MKSVGEVMAIGRTFQESLQKALRGLETGLTGLDEIAPSTARRRRDRDRGGAGHADARPAARRRPGDARGPHVEEIHAILKYDPWFLARIAEIVERGGRDLREGLPRDAAGMRRLKAMGFSPPLKAMGFSDARLLHDAVKADRRDHRGRGAALRHKLGVRPVFKRIDTCAAEFEAKTPYMYSTYEAPSFGEARGREPAVGPQEGRHPRRRAQPDRPGHRVRLLLLPRRLRAGEIAGFETIMVNCNPETVSTDYDTSDRLYFEPLTARTCSRSSHVERRAARCSASSSSSAARRR
jgi:carbamoyl-phosphate synthase large subunit